MALTVNTTPTPVPPSSGPGTEPDGRTPSVNAALATFGTSDWAIADEPSLEGNTFTLQLNNLPIESGYTFVFAQIEVDGSQVRDVDYGGKIWVDLPERGETIPYLRRHYTTPETLTSIKIRPVYYLQSDYDTNQDSATLVAGAWSTAKTVTPSIGTPSIDVYASRTTGTAPFMTHLYIEPKGFSVLRPWRDLRIKGTISGTVPTLSRLPADHPHGRDTDTTFTYLQSFVMDTAGSYTVTISVDDGVTSTVTDASTVLTVTDSDTVYAGEIFTVGSDPSDDYATVSAMLSGVGAVTNLKFTYRKGESHTPAKITKGANVWIGAHGTGADPIINGRVQVSNNASSGDITVTGLDVQGGVVLSDVTDGTDRGSNGIETTNGAIPNSLTIWNNKISKHGIGIVSEDTRHLYVGNVEYTEMHNYFCLHGNPEHPAAFLGCYIHQIPNLIRANGKADNGTALKPYSPDHVGIRFSNPFAPVSFDQLNTYSNFAWSGATQPIIRWGQSHSASGQDFVGQRMCIEGEVGSPGSDNQNTLMNVRAILEKIIGGPGESGKLKANASGIAIRNCIWNYPGREYESSRGPTSFIGQQGAGDPENTMYLVKFTGGSGTKFNSSFTENITGNSTLTDGKWQGTLHVESGTFAGADAAGAVVVRVITGSVSVSEVLTDGNISITVASVAPFLSGLDPFNPNLKSIAYNNTFAHWCTDAELDGNSSAAGIDILDVAGSAPGMTEVNNLLHAPNLSADKGGTSAYAPVDTTTNWTHKHAGRRFYYDYYLSYTNGNGQISRGATITASGGTASGASGKVLLIQTVDSGSFGGGDAAGTIAIFYEATSDWNGIDFAIGDVCTDGTYSFTVSAVSKWSDGGTARTANTDEISIVPRPQSGSAAIGAANKSEPFALDDFYGTLRGASPSIGAVEPA